MTTATLALRHTDPPGMLGVFAKLIRLRLPTTVPLAVAMERIGHRIGRPYDWASLLAFVLPVSVRWIRADYCFEFCWYVLTGENPTGRVTAEQLLALVAQQLAAQQQPTLERPSP